MAKLLKLRRGTTSQHSSFTGAEGEVTVDTDKETLVVHNGSTAGGFPVARADGTGVTNFTITGELDAATLDISGNADIDGTLEADAYTVDGTALNEYIADTVGAMVTGNTETGIAVTYEDGDNTLDFVVNNATGLTGTPDITVGVVTAGSLDISGNADIDGTLEADAYTVNGTALDTHIAGVTVTNATNAAHVSVADNESTNENNKIVFIEDASATGNVGLESDGDLHYNPSTGLLTVPAVSTSGNITIAGNLTVNGTTTTVATTNTTVTDNLLELNSGAGSNANDAGILIERGSTGDNAIIAWDESADKFTVGTTTATNSATGNISITTGTLVANVEGNVTGNVTGNLTGTASSATNADTVDNLHAASFVRSDADDTVANHLTFTDSDAFPVDVNNSNNGKIRIGGSVSPYIQFRENTTDKAYFQWHGDGYIKIKNEEDSSTLLIKDDITFSTDGSTFHKVWHAGNDGNGSGLDADTLDGVSSGSFLRGDVDDTTAGHMNFARSNDEKFALSGSNSPYFRFKEGTTSKAFMQWNSGGWITIKNEEDNSLIRFKDGLDFSQDGGSSYLDIIHQGNVGSGGSLSSTTVYTGNIRDSKGDARDIPSAAKSSAYTLVNTDGGKVIYTSSGGVTLPNSVMAGGNTVTIINNSGSDQTITQASGLTLYNTADASTGNRVLAGRGMCTVWYASGSVAYISGAGLS